MAEALRADGASNRHHFLGGLSQPSVTQEDVHEVDMALSQFIAYAQRILEQDPTKQAFAEAMQVLKECRQAIAKVSQPTEDADRTLGFTA